MRRSLITTIALLTACASRRTDPADVARSEAQLVEHGLTYPVRIAGAPALNMNLTERMAFYRVPDVTIAVVRGNRLYWTLARGTGVSDTTRFQVASISKPVTALAALRLVDEGVLSLDRPVNEVLRSWRIPDNGFTAVRAVTLRHLLSHSGGLTNGAVGIYPPGRATPTLLQALDGLPPSSRPAVRVDFEPGSRWRYSGGGYAVLQQLLIDVTGEDFPALTKRLVLDPLGMHSSGFLQPLPDSLASCAAPGHDRQGQVIEGRWWTLPEMAAGGLWSTAPDMARLIIGLNAAWSGAPGALLHPSTAREMMRRQIDDWGLGVAVDTAGGEIRVSHTGSNNGYRAIIVALPARGDGIAVLTNGDNGGSLRDEIIRAAAARYGWPGYAQQERRAAALSPALMQELLGRYDYGRGFVTDIVRDGPRVLARLNDGPLYELFTAATADELFTLEGVVYRVERDAAGRITALRADLGGGGPPLVGRRVEGH
jgi:CubicO group peptidase (beta-lactamase class C family)